MLKLSLNPPIKYSAMSTSSIRKNGAQRRAWGDLVRATPQVTDSKRNRVVQRLSEASMKNTLLLLILTVSAYAQTGLGKTTYTCIDQDGDHYGVGPGCLGPDADDNDATVHSAAEVIAKYGTLKAFLTHLGYNPTRIFYLSATGNDSTAVVDDPAHPYQSWSSINLLMANKTFKAGDMVMLRAGTFKGMTMAPMSGMAGSPVILMAYPGETVWVDNSATGASNLSIVDTSYIIADGLKFAGGLGNGGCISGGTSDGNSSITFHDNVFRNLEETFCQQGMMMAGLSNVTIEYNLIHDIASGGQHCIYIGARRNLSSNTTIHGNVCYNAPWNGFHVNGRITNLRVEQNIIYSTGIAGISFQNGTSASFIRNNLIFNNAAAGIEFSNYPLDCSVYGDGAGTLCPWDQTGNVIENNTVYMVGPDPFTGGATSPAAVRVNNYSDNQAGDLGHNTFRNNIFVGYGMAGHYPAVVYYNGDKSYLSTSTFANNVFWSLDGATDPYVIANGYSPSFGFQGYTCSQAPTVTNMTGCFNADPRFTDVSPTYYKTQSRFNFALLSGSPAISSGTTVDAPLVDILGTPRSNPPTIGAYEFGSVPTLPILLVSSLACSPASLMPGSVSTCTATLTQAAPPGGATVTVASSTKALAVPATVLAPAGSSAATFSATAAADATPQTATISATLSGASQTSSISLVSLSVTTVSSLVCSPTTLTVGMTATCTVTVSQVAGANSLTIVLSSDTGLLTLPASITVAGGSSSGTFTVAAGTILTNTTSSITATLNGASKSVSLILVPAVGPVGSGWQELPTTAIQAVCPPNNFGGINYPFFNNCRSVVSAWSGAALDTRRNRLIVWGGGHVDYSGNEVYALNLGAKPATMVRLTDPSDFTKNIGCPDANPDGTPVSRHTYQGFVYLKRADRLLNYGGAKAPCGSEDNTSVWTLDLSQTPPVWRQETVLGDKISDQLGSGNTCAYNEAGSTSTVDSVLCWQYNWAYVRIDYDTVAHTVKATSLARIIAPNYPTTQSTTVIDPVRQLEFYIGADQYGGLGPKMMVHDLRATSGWAVSDWTSLTTGCSALINSAYPGLAYDSVLDRIVGWPNTGSSVYVFNPDTKTCVTQTFANGPANASAAGTFGRFQYVPGLDAFVVVNDAGNNAFLLRLSPASPPTCDLNGDGVVNATDVQLAIDQSLGVSPCGSADLQQIGQCDVVGVQRVVVATMGGACRVGQ